MSQEYLNVLTTYGIYAKSLWHDAEPGGYWGDGIAAKNQNGGVRGMSNTLITYAMLVHGLDEGWLADNDAKLLRDAGLTRDKLVHYARAELDYMIAHHKSAAAPVEPEWGFWWQSPLWMQAVGPAVMLLWKDLSAEEREGITRVAAAEADRIAAMRPKDYLPGDTGAEENAWNTAAPAVALALAPQDKRADSWWHALRAMAVNTYSIPADRTSTTTVGTDVVGQIVTTANLFNDFTLENHGFFHPDYVQVSGQHLGEAWIILKMGDSLHGTNWAQRFRPYGLHHVADVWEKVARPLLLPSGEFAFPNGNDWTFHCSTIQSYLAYIATALGDPVAASAEREGIKHVQRRRAVSPPGRLLGDTNLEWWWEPLVCKRACTAMLHHELQGKKSKLEDNQSKPQRHRGTEEGTERAGTEDRNADETRFYQDAKVWLHRNSKYLVTAAWGAKHMATLYPLGELSTETVYMTLPMPGSILPASITTATAITDGGSMVPGKDRGMAKYPTVPALWLTGTDRSAVEIYALPQSILILADVPLNSIGIENDSLTTPGRVISHARGHVQVSALSRNPKFETSNWLELDGRLAVITSGTLTYRSPGKWNGKSVAWDEVSSNNPLGALQLAVIGQTGTAAKLSEQFHAPPSSADVTLVDSDGKPYRFLPAFYSESARTGDRPLQCCGSDFMWY